MSNFPKSHFLIVTKYVGAHTNRKPSFQTFTRLRDYLCSMSLSCTYGV